MIATRPHRDVFVTVDGLRLHAVEHVGAGERSAAPPVLLLHGVTGHAAVWHDVAEPLSAHRRVLALDFRGFGDSQWSPTASYRTTDHAADVVGMLDALAIDQATLVGSSWGALVALAVSAIVPARVDRLVMVDVEPSFTQGETDLFPRPRTYAAHAEAVAHERAANPHAGDALLDVVAASGTRPGPDGSLVPKHDPVFFERWPFRSDDWWDALATVAAPALVVHAGASFVRREITERMSATFANGHHVEIPESTHVVPIDAPAPLAAALLSFLEA
jgi:pimeloyl-ACP methyl ester carboxylesterase